MHHGSDYTPYEGHGSDGMAGQDAAAGRARSPTMARLSARRDGPVPGASDDAERVKRSSRQRPPLIKAPREALDELIT